MRGFSSAKFSDDEDETEQGCFYAYRSIWALFFVLVLLSNYFMIRIEGASNPHLALGVI